MIPSQGERDLLAYAVNAARPENLVLRLYANDWTPGLDDDASAYVEVSGGGYAAATLRGAAWAVEERAEHAVQVFVFSGAVGDVFGWYMTRAKSGRLAWAGRFADGPYAVGVRGDRIKITPRLELARRLASVVAFEARLPALGTQVQALPLRKKRRTSTWNSPKPVGTRSV